ncbi:Type 2 phosphatidylinositol 4,5-bisphosphate 4-phosphatase [Striga asiatica]|uniref:Type 2 phosphatidylinositol 4,5-bisphosphate 4-phosphatase n=1 Tax=Striga asiatica TaxID=4170 RepID=A0A5A7RDC4_STRAF|nr:Type 2 phosphatidylinositol 4,5-bisphosphate 4-phosphatase [Striga asiatica]
MHLVVKKYEKILVRKTLSSLGSSISSTEPASYCSAALLTRISILPPKAAATSSTTRLQFSSKPRSAGTANGSLAPSCLAFLNISNVSFASLSSWPLTYVNATLAPSRAKQWHTARPMPEVNNQMHRLRPKNFELRSIKPSQHNKDKIPPRQHQAGGPAGKASRGRCSREYNHGPVILCPDSNPSEPGVVEGPGGPWGVGVVGEDKCGHAVGHANGQDGAATCRGGVHVALAQGVGVAGE